MLERWRQIRSMDNVQLNIIYAGDGSMSHITSGVSVAAVNADSEDILKSNAMQPQIAVTINATGQLSPSKTPREVATPLPPLKRKNTGYR